MSWFRKIKASIWIPVGGILFIVLIMSFIAGKNSSVDAYFDNNHLPKDVLGQYEYLTSFLDQPINSFQGYEGIPQRQYKFQLAFMSYALASIAQTDSAHRQQALHYMDRLIQKMKQPVVWEDWIEDGFGTDPLAKNNMMYRGHLNLMMNLYQLTSGDAKYQKEAERLTEDIFREMKSNFFCGVLCEPDNYYVACNSVGVLSLVIYDKLHRTNFSSIREQWFRWIENNMTHPERKVLATLYHPSTQKIDGGFQSRHNAWDVVFLHAINPEIVSELYSKFKRAFVWKFLGFTAIKNRPGGLVPDPTATGFGIAAAKEMGDRKLFGELLNSLRWAGLPKWKKGELHYRTSNLLGDTILFFGKVCRLRDLVVSDWK